MIEPNRQGEVWVFAEQEDGSLHDVVLELCGKARELADRLGVQTGVVLPGSNVGGLAKQLIAYGADNVYQVDDPRLGHYQTAPYARVLCSRVDMGAYESGIGDYTCDGVLALTDYASWPACMTGPNAPGYPAGCASFDLDGDEDVDLEDFAEWVKLGW